MYDNSSNIEYELVPTSDHDTSISNKNINSINSDDKSNDLELIEGDNLNLVDYEIKTDQSSSSNKYKRNRNKDNNKLAEKGNEL